MVLGKEKPSLPRTAFPLDPDGLLYLDKSSAEDAWYACGLGSEQSDGGLIAICVVAIKGPIPFLLFWGGFIGLTSERNNLCELGCSESGETFSSYS
jgi:hypothetical protein